MLRSVHRRCFSANEKRGVDMLLAGLIALLIGSTEPTISEGLMTKRLQDPLIATLQTKKKIADIEFCLADAFSRDGQAIFYDDGPHTVKMVVNFVALSSGILAIATLNQNQNETVIEIRGNEKYFTVRHIDKRVDDCL